MLCLGIETSCDDTSLALVRNGRLLGQATAGQADLHALFGGVVPELASREHARLIGPLYDRLLEESGVSPGDLDVIAVARGPGLLGSLLVGVAFAKALALGMAVPLVGVNHLHAHIFSAALERPLPLPALALLVSGGHTHLYLVLGPNAFECLGKSLDDAAGEAFDKAGKMLGLPYPAGRHIDELAEEGRADPALFPRPYLTNDNLDFSFSGLKTAMQTRLSGQSNAAWDALTGDMILPKGLKRQEMADLCASYRLAIVDTLLTKTQRALHDPRLRDAKSLILAGGVAANSLLRRRMAELARLTGIEFVSPSPELCTDNGAMIACLGGLLAAKGLGHDLDLASVPRGRAIPDDMRAIQP
ncbi:tRNA (adenosine(37)-N6)-threonylcarbamoyltransferase complex transferase subunit TsaD [Desulfovibrio sp. OttesenSCG-928-F20]|nr:tRNA (adenosine(37)-N6)-threonylcarbamoyltransferase complex transferase subunit TsaD [Desulfovibrio sp. OttesenSCG-928-M16]MDL2290582.1 tRNA (adenosine(37)-N6)-threonylcarbamoyltransferase complex transferase subunit TsaD [Desulfovibrio sp. OttesenSCG-928-F20]